MKKIAIVQSNYIPWKGYFDLIASVDEFILYDDMQFTRRDWRNRNKIKTPQGTQWITVPVKVKGRYYQRIKDTEIDGTDWAEKHWTTISNNYRRSPHFEQVADWIEPLYRREHTNLSALNRTFIETICKAMQITTKISCSSDYQLVDGKTERLAHLCRDAGGTDYVSGPAAKTYCDEQVFRDLGLGLHWFDYSDYPEYAQQWSTFTHEVTVLDLLFNCGEEFRSYMKYV